MVLLSRADDEDAPALEPAATRRLAQRLVDGRLDGPLGVHGMVSSQQLDSRLTDLTLSTRALRQPTHPVLDLSEALPSILATLSQASIRSGQP